jgi:hypothetical protein
MAKEWQGDDFDILRCNCCHFSHELLRYADGTEMGKTPMVFE